MPTHKPDVQAQYFGTILQPLKVLARESKISKVFLDLSRQTMYADVAGLIDPSWNHINNVKRRWPEGSLFNSYYTEL